MNHNVAPKSKSSQRQIINQDGKFDFRKNIAAIERVRAPNLDSKSHREANDVSGSNRGEESGYVYSPSSDMGNKHEQNVKRHQ